jgi:hypothetical protein
MESGDFTFIGPQSFSIPDESGYIERDKAAGCPVNATGSMESEERNTAPSMRSPKEAAALIWQQWDLCRRLAANNKIIGC